MLFCVLCPRPFHGSQVLSINAFLLTAALCGVVMYNYLKVKDARVLQHLPESIPERISKVSPSVIDILEILISKDVLLGSIWR